MRARPVRQLAVDAWRRAEAMGLIGQPGAGPESIDVAHLVTRLRGAGIARETALRFDIGEPASVEEAESLLRLVLAALEASPVPRFEWAAVSRVLEPEQLAGLLNISVTSLRRYASGERETPDEVAARLHHLALVVGNLSGAYNEVGVRRWFERTRTALNGRTPAELLSGDWKPEDAAARKVRDLARSLVTVPAT